jgi:hypothetical protein
MPIGDALKRAAGLFIEVDANSDSDSTPSAAWSVMDQPSTAPKPAPATSLKTVDQIVRDSPGPNLDEIKASASPAQPVITDDGRVNFAAIYGLAALPTAGFTAEQVLEILSSLPDSLPMEAKKATLKVTLDAMGRALGVGPESVVADASRKLAALASYAQNYTNHATEYAAKAGEEITKLQQEIETRKTNIADAKTKQEAMVEACHSEGERLSTVLDFFSQTPPKL